MSHTKGGTVIECNTGTFELLKAGILKHYSAFKSFEHLQAELIACEDKSGSQPELKVKVRYPSNTTCYTVNVYSTTCRILINGRGLGKFLDIELGKILSSLPDTGNSLNEAIKSTLQSAKKRKTATTSEVAISLVDQTPQNLTLSPSCIILPASPAVDQGSCHLKVEADKCPSCIIIPASLSVDQGSCHLKDGADKCTTIKAASSKAVDVQVSSTDVYMHKENTTIHVPSSHSSPDKAIDDKVSAMCTAHVPPNEIFDKVKTNASAVNRDPDQESPPKQVIDGNSNDGKWGVMFKQIAEYNKSIQNLEQVFVNTIKQAYEDLTVMQKKTYSNEIEMLRSQNEQQKVTSTKELENMAKEKDDLVKKLNQVKADLNKSRECQTTLGKEMSAIKENYTKLQHDYDLTRKSHKIDLDAFGKDLYRVHGEKEKLGQIVTSQQEENKSQCIQIEKKKTEAEVLEERCQNLQKEISSCHDEIISLKISLGAAQVQGKYTEVREDHDKSTIYFKGDQHPLSNLFHINNGIEIFTHKFFCVEAAYHFRHAIHENNYEAANNLLQCKDAWHAMSIGSNINKSQEWHGLKEMVMEEILQAKLKSCPEYREFLQTHKTSKLVENTEHPFWGRGTYAEEGQNKLGKLHMKLRSSVSTGQYGNDHAPSQKVAQLDLATTPHPSCDTTSQSNKVESSQAHNHEKVSETKDVLLIGNSHTSSNFHLNHLNRKIKLEKRSAMTISEARREVQRSTKRDVIVIHEVTNDIGNSEDSAIKCADHMTDLVSIALDKADKVVVSLGIPRFDSTHKHELVQVANSRIENRLAQKKNVAICRHDNFFNYGKPISNYIARDGYHMSTAGKYVFAQNLTKSIHTAALYSDDRFVSWRPKTNYNHTSQSAQYYGPQSSYNNNSQPGEGYDRSGHQSQNFYESSQVYDRPSYQSQNLYRGPEYNSSGQFYNNYQSQNRHFY
jgi:ribA/ribD-fused uncharacterized protein